MLPRGQAFQSPVNLLWRPVLLQPQAHRCLDFGVVHLPQKGAFTASILRMLLSLSCQVLTARTVTFQLAANRRGAAFQCSCDRILPGSSMFQFRNPVSIFHRQMTCHRWDSLPKRTFQAHTPSSRKGSSHQPRSHPKYCVSDCRPPFVNNTMTGSGKVSGILDLARK